VISQFLQEPRVAYFSMEIALRSEIPTYAALAARSSWPAHTIRMVWPADAAIKGRNRVRRSTIGWPEVGVRTTPGVMQRKSQWRLSVLRQTPGARSGRVCALTNGIRSGSPE